MDRTASKEVGRRATPHCSTGWHGGGTSLIAVLCTTCLVLFTSEAIAQCTARDVLRNRLTLKSTLSANMPPVLVTSAVAVPVWKTITVGMFADSLALRNALDAAGCGIGDSAEEILARPAFTLSTTKTDVELIAVSVTELGFPSFWLWLMAEQDWFSSAKMLAPTQKYQGRAVFYSCDPMKPY